MVKPRLRPDLSLSVEDQNEPPKWRPRGRYLGDQCPHKHNESRHRLFTFPDLGRIMAPSVILPMNLLPTSQELNPWALIGAQHLVILGFSLGPQMITRAAPMPIQLCYARINEQTLFYSKKFVSTKCETKRLMGTWVQGSVHFRRPTDHD
ncbi:hypothetical protein BO94DRAFT_351973 [Aspergillus sclerotioniger CBS 115572]|uniref:Uncharacterized protein n=1 Tax=Aspergillus sclerotioniger CBS 115572 TaxID=1450535 RepID=A0A317X593_9EURO|nr:hypothetical protein BO94DRAFT_351973 [Aspergillus sclerotioniger CBS 115572]PWY93766.1 hypothetical protein BO94DRAFT_351973 [Aspergillus sclerotioniger CBS 115572]